MNQRLSSPRRRAKCESTSGSELEQLAANSGELAGLVAGNLAAPGALLEKLSASPNEMVRKRVVANPNTPTRALRKLAADFPVQLLENPLLTVKLLQDPKLLSGLSPEQMDSLLKRRDAPKAVIRYAVRLKQGRLQLALVRNPVMPIEVVRELSRSGSSEEVRRLANRKLQNPSSTVAEHWLWDEICDRLGELYHYPKKFAPFHKLLNDTLAAPKAIKWVRLWKRACNPETGDPELVRLARSTNSLVQGALVERDIPVRAALRLAATARPVHQKFLAKKRDQIPPVLRALAFSNDAEVRLHVADHRNTALDVLAELADDDDFWVRVKVANHRSASKRMLERLAQDSAARVRFRVAKHPDVPVSALRILSKDENKHVRQAVGEDSRTPANVLRHLANDGEKLVRWAVARNPSTPSKILERLAVDSVEEVRWGVGQNSSAPLELLEKLAKSGDYQMRWSVALNESTPLSVLEKLAKDRNRHVRSGVAQNSSATKDTRERLHKYTLPMRAKKKS